MQKKRKSGKILQYPINHATENSIIKSIILNGTDTSSKQWETNFCLLSISVSSLTAISTIWSRQCKIDVSLSLRRDTQVTRKATRKASSSDHLSDSQLTFRCINMQATPKLRWMRGRARGVCSRSLFPQEPWHEALIPQRERRVTALFTTRATSSAPSSLAWRWLCYRCLLFYHVFLSYSSLSTTGPWLPLPPSFSPLGTSGPGDL